MKLSDNISLENAAIGGLILGITSSGLLYKMNKITGISGILEGAVLKFDGIEISYILGLLSSGMILSVMKPDVFGSAIKTTTSGTCTLVISGFLIGLGTRLGSGCTSGHGICGLPRLSLRSLTAVGTFMITGAISAYYTRQYRIPVDNFDPFIRTYTGPVKDDLLTFILPTAITVAGTYILRNIFNSDKNSNNKSNSISEMFQTFSSSMIFGIGLGISGMLNPQRVLKFLDFTNTDDGWDPSLMGVMGAGVLFNMITFNFISKKNKELAYGTVPSNMKIDYKLLLGSGLFGCGWGWAGVCPGPAIVSFGAGVGNTIYFVPSMIVGMLFNDLLKIGQKKDISSTKST